jgi:peptide methionine sulfoxide reductase MsrA
MACDITSGIELGCRDGVGGVRKVWILGGANNEVTAIAQDADGYISGVTGTGTLYEFELVKNTSSYQEVINASVENGVVSYAQTLNLIFHRIEQVKRNQIRLLAQNYRLDIFVELQDGTQFYLGEVNGMTLNSGTAASGTNIADRNGYELEFIGAEPEPANQMAGDGLGSADVTLSGITL